MSWACLYLFHHKTCRFSIISFHLSMPMIKFRKLLDNYEYTQTHNRLLPRMVCIPQIYTSGKQRPFLLILFTPFGTNSVCERVRVLYINFIWMTAIVE